MKKRVTSYLFLRLFVLFLSITLGLPVYAQYPGAGGATIHGMLKGTTTTFDTEATVTIGCTYTFTFTSPSICSLSGGAVAWSLSQPTTGVSIGNGGNTSGTSVELTFLAAASSFQKLHVQATGYSCATGGQSPSSQTASGDIILHLVNYNPSGLTLVAPAPAPCANTDFALTLSNNDGVTSVDWSGNGQTATASSANDNFRFLVKGGITGPTVFQATITSGCSGTTTTKTITVTPQTELASQAVGERDVVAGNNQGTVTLTTYNGTIQSWQSAQNANGPWNTIAQTTEDLMYSNLSTTTWFRGVTSLCGTLYYSDKCVIRTHALTDDLSWTETKTFGLDGTTLTSDSRTYVDGFAKPLQSQSKSLSQQKILVTQPLYGKYDQAVGSTLAAPITPTDFAYTPTFISPASASTTAYDYTRFDDVTTLNAPEAVSTTSAGTLGHYYSANNTLEKYTAITSYPYTRTDAMPDGSTGVSRSVGPGVDMQMGMHRENVQGTFPVRTELDDYAAIRNALLSTTAVGSQVTSFQQAAVQSLSRDADGTSALTFIDKEGHPVMSARPATATDAWASVSNTVEVGWPHSVKIPANSPLLTTLLQFSGTADIMAFDSQGSFVLTGSPDQVAQQIGSSADIQNYLFYSTDPFTVSNDPGTGTSAVVTYTSQQREAYPFFNFYLVGDGTASVASTPSTLTSTYSLVNTVTGEEVAPSGLATLPAGCYQLRIKSGAVTLTYSNKYKDISFGFYNQKGQVVLAIAPKGVKEFLQNWSPTGPTPTLTYSTTFEYDQQGRQIASTETDAGRTSFVYRADGKLRFSQNAKQLLTGAFSYLGYDAIGRVVEVGECTPADNNAAFSHLLTTHADWIEDTGYGGAGLLEAYPRRDIVRTTYDVVNPLRGPAEAPNSDHQLAGYTPAFLGGRVATTAKYATGQPFGNYVLLSQNWFSYDEQGRTQWQIQRAADGSPLAAAAGTTSGLPASYAAAGLVGYWRLEEGSGSTVADASGKGNTGTIAGTVNWATGQWVAGQPGRGHALSFGDNGNQGYVRAEDAPSLHLNTTLTLEAWINPTDRGNTSVILSKDKEYALVFTSDAHVYCAFNNLDANNPKSGWTYRQTGILIQPNNTWTHVAVTYDKGVITAYQNGLVVSTDTWGSPNVPIQASGSALILGGGVFAGALDEVHIWNTVRTPAQIRVDAGINQTSSGPLAGYWRLEEGSGTTVADASGNANAGTITGTVNWVAGQGGGSALSFSDNGNQGHVSAADAPSLRLSTTLTLEAWVKPTNRANPAVILSKDNEYEVFLTTDGHVYCSFHNEDPLNASSGWSARKTGIFLDNNVWTHIAISYDNGVIHAYQNGVEVSHETWGSPNVPIQYTGSAFHIGSEADGNPFYGAIDEVRLWNVARTPSQILADATAPSTGTTPPVASATSSVHTIDYTYDVAGNTATVCYQQQTPAERLTHYYTYDADNRLSVVQTDNAAPGSSVPGNRQEQARYTYYLHGPLKRVVYGGNLQGVDYTYTATGQLKAINDGDIAQDPGQDGTGTSSTVYPDFLGLSLHYYPTDYTSAAVPNLTTTVASGTDFQPRYNGLVSGSNWQTPGSARHAYGYNYDDKGQLLKANYGLLTTTGGRQYTFTPDPLRYQESNLDYDANGNIGHLQRTDGMGAATLAGSYQYASGTNQLNQVLHAGAAQVSYTYDAIGQVTAQQERDPTLTKYLEYDAAGKVTALYADATHTQVIARYTYDEFGKRLAQQVYANLLDPTSYTTTTFVRDVAGHELSSYVAVTTAGVTAPAFLYEQPIYGATRLGIYRQARDKAPAEQLYELNDQLGNTRVVFRKPTTTTYVLSMEDAYASQERQDFPAPTAGTYDATRSADMAYPLSPYGQQYSIKVGGTGSDQSPTRIIPAQRGDTFHFTAYAAYDEQGAVYTSLVPTSPASPIFPSVVGVRVGQATPAVSEQAPASSPGWQQALSHFSLGVSIPMGALVRTHGNSLGNSSTTNATDSPGPSAYLQLLVRDGRDNHIVRTATAFVHVSTDLSWQSLSTDLTITEDYPVVVEVSARGDSNVPVYFDDLTLQYTPGPVIEENQYYAYGQRLDGLSWRRTDERLYGRGYQGQNTTQDAESSYTAFDLRMYDARYGRWLMNDPMRQHASGYLGMGNNPVSNVDIDGGEDEGWYENAQGQMKFDPAVTSQANTPTGGTYYGETASRPMADGGTWEGNSNGTENYRLSEFTVTATRGQWFSHEDAVGYQKVSDGGAEITATAFAFMVPVGEALGALRFVSKIPITNEFTLWGFKSIQTLTKIHSEPLNAFFKSGGIAETPAFMLRTYRELAVRIVTQTGGAPVTKLTTAALETQTSRIAMIDKALNAIK